MTRLPRPLERQPGPECICGAELKTVPLPDDLAALAGRKLILVHVENGDTRCYPDARDAESRKVTAELQDTR